MSELTRRDAQERAVGLLTTGAARVREEKAPLIIAEAQVWATLALSLPETEKEASRG